MKYADIMLETIDFRGQTERSRLEQMPLHNEIYWMAWSHWFPDTELLD